MELQGRGNLRVLGYTIKKGLEENIPPEKIRALLDAKETILWLDIINPKDEDFQLLESLFHFHPLALRECKSVSHPPKLMDFSDHLFVVWHALESTQEVRKLDTVGLCVFLGGNYLVTVHYQQLKVLDQIYSSCKEDASLISKGSRILFYNILDRIADEYFLFLDSVSEAIDVLEDKMFENPSKRDVRELFSFKHQIITLRKIISPEREIINTILRHPVFVGTEAQIYYQDIYDHLVRGIDLIDTFRDILSGTMEIYLSSISNRLNEVMKTLTIIATIMMPPTLLAGIYGMNIYIPGLHWKYMFLVLAVLTIGFIILMLYIFKKRKWI